MRTTFGLKSFQVRTAFLLAACGAGLLGALIAGGLVFWPKGESCPGTFCVEAAGPAGSEVPVTTPVTISFRGNVDRKLAERSLVISPSAEGGLSWKGNTLRFTPEWPGFARGITYQVNLEPPHGQASSSEAVPFSFTTAGKLKVASVIPEAGAIDIDTGAVLIVQFNRSVAPLAALTASPPKQVLDFDPPVEGAGEWINTSLYSFQPSGGWQPATGYTVTVSKGLSDVLGGTLEEDFVWSFHTVMPAVAEVFPTDNSEFVGPRSEVKVTFNQPMDRTAAEVAFSMAVLGTDRRPEGTFSWPDDRTLVFQASSPLELEATYEVAVPAGLANASGNAHTAVERRWTFRTVGAPRVASSRPANGETQAEPYGVEIRFSNPMDRDSVEDNLAISPEPENDPYFYWDDSEPVLHIGFAMEPTSSYSVSIEGARDRYGQPMAPFHLSFTTRPLQPSVSIVRPEQTGTFDAYLTPRVLVRAVNATAAELSLYRMERSTFMQLDAKPWETSDYVPPKDALVRRWTEQVPDPPLNRPVTVTVPLNDLEGRPLPPGLYLLVTSGPGIEYEDRLPIVVSKTHLTLKRARGQILVWALDMASGEAVADMEVTVFDWEGQQVAAGRTGPDGVFESSLPDVPQDEYYLPLYVVGERAGDEVTASTNWESGVSAWAFDLPYWSVRSDYVAHLYTERPIYRPGETVFCKGVLREDHDARYEIPESDPGVTLVLSDSFGREVLSSEVRLSDLGTFDGKIELSPDAPTGSYWLHLKKGQEFIETSSFQVAEFRTPQFEASVEPERREYVTGETVRAQVSSSYFFGAPVADAPVSWRVTSQDFGFHSDDYPGYSFFDYDEREYREFGRPRSDGEGRTDAGGSFMLEVPADLSADPISQSFLIEATVTDVNEQEVSASAEVLVHKASFYAGLKPGSYVSVVGEPTQVDMVTLDTQGKPLGSIPLQVSIFHRRWATVKVREPDGEYRYESKPIDTIAETRQLVTDESGEGSLSFTPSKGGTWRVVVEALDSAGNPVRSATSVWVSSSDYVSWEVTNDHQLQLVADKKEYSPGETARILVTAPFVESTGLITIERGGILSHELRNFQTNSEVLEIPVTSDHIPNVFVSVASFKAPTAENALPSFKVGYVELPVSTDEKELSMTIEASSERLEPGQAVTYTITTRDSQGKGVPAEVTLALVDKALLSLAEQEGPTPAEAFWSRRPAGVTTAATFVPSIDRSNELVLSRHQGAKGGSGGGGEIETSRKFFPRTAYWNPSLRTDKDGRAQVTVNLPDSLTTWRLSARALTAATEVGEGANEVVTSKELIVRPVTPRFLVVGDRPVLKAVVHNFSDVDQEVQVSLSAEGVAVSEPATQAVSVESGGLTELAWQTEVGQGPSAKLRFEAEAGDGLADCVELELPVQDYVTAETVATGGKVVDEAYEVVQVPYFARPERGELTIALAPSLAAGLREGLRFLDEYPYESVEQTVGRLLSRIGLYRAARKLNLPETEELSASLEEMVPRSLLRLYAQQHYDGGWGWWLSSRSDAWITAYVLLGLGEAKAEAYSPATDAVARATKYLLEELDRPSDALNPQSPDLRALILYALARAGQGDLGRTYNLAEQRTALSSSGKALVVLTLRELGAPTDDPRLRYLISDLTTSAVAAATGSHWQDGAPTTDSGPETATQATAFALRALAVAQPDHPLIEEAARWLMVSRRDGHWETTHDTALSVLALADYVVAREEMGDFSYEVEVNDRRVHAGEAKASEAAKTEEVLVELADLLLDQENSVRLARSPATAKGKLYYTLRMRYFTPAEDIEALTEGVGVGREYLPVEGGDERLESVPVGSLVKVKLTVVAPSDLRFVVVEDMLPAGLEPIDVSLKTTSFELREYLFGEERRIFEERERQRLLVNPFDHVEIRDNRVVLFATSMPKGVYEYVYLARATTPGQFHVPPARAYEMYFPEVQGRTDGAMFEVRP